MTDNMGDPEGFGGSDEGSHYMATRQGFGTAESEPLGHQRGAGHKAGDDKGVNLKVLSEVQSSTIKRRDILPSTMKGCYRLVEIYDSVKGEGTQAGMPMTFVRFANCNLACDFCDTPYNRVAIELSPRELLSNILDREPAWVIFTGGEPCMQLRQELTTQLKQHGIKMAIETNGMIWTDAFYDLDYINISPKCCYTSPDDPIPVEKRLSSQLVISHNNSLVTIDELRWIICSSKDDRFELPELTRPPRAHTFSPLMYDAEPEDSFTSGKGHRSIFGIIDNEAFNRCLHLVHKYRHEGGRLSVQVHKFVGVR